MRLLNEYVFGAFSAIGCLFGMFERFPSRYPLFSGEIYVMIDTYGDYFCFPENGLVFDLLGEG